jgi:anti-anti-sigma factor
MVPVETPPARTPHACARLIGEVDLSTRSTFEGILAKLIPAGAAGSHVHLDLSGLTFIDVAGVVALVKRAEALGANGCLVLHEPPLMLRRILDILWTPQPPALQLRGRWSPREPSAECGS